MDLIDRAQLMNYIRSRKINIGKLAHDVIMKQPSIQPQEPCEDAISRQAVLDELNKWDCQELYLPIHFKENIIDVVPSVKPQEPFDIETYCKEHFCVMVDKDVWEKAEKALKQEHTYGYWRQVGYDIYECTVCSQTVMTGDICAYKHCHGCGAKMNEMPRMEYVPNHIFENWIQ